MLLFFLVIVSLVVGCVADFSGSKDVFPHSHCKGSHSHIYEDRLICHGTNKSVAARSVSNKNYNCICLFIIVVVVVVMAVMAMVIIAEVLRLLVGVPIQQAQKTISETFVHGTPFFAVLSTVTPILRTFHAVPLVINIHTGISRMGNIAGRNRVCRRDGIGWRRGNITFGIIFVRVRMRSR